MHDYVSCMLYYFIVASFVIDGEIKENCKDKHGGQAPERVLASREENLKDHLIGIFFRLTWDDTAPEMQLLKIQHLWRKMEQVGCAVNPAKVVKQVHKMIISSVIEFFTSEARDDLTMVIQTRRAVHYIIDFDAFIDRTLQYWKGEVYGRIPRGFRVGRQEPYERENFAKRMKRASIIPPKRNVRVASSEEIESNNYGPNNGNGNGGNMDGFVQNLVDALRNLTGTGGPLAAEEWIRELERIFNYLGCPDAQKVTCAAFQFTEDAGHWWEPVTLSINEEQQRNLTWTAFKKLVLGNYFPKAFRKQKEKELMNLEQGDMIILEYEQKFNQLARYDPHLVDTDKKKAWRFEDGLRAEIGAHISALNLTTFSEIVQRARAVSTRLNLGKLAPRPSNNGGKRHWDDRGNPNKGKGFQPEKKPRNDGENKPGATVEKPLCPTCQRRHFGKCRLAEEGCYRCHQVGHKAVNCPQNRNFNNNNNNRRGNTPAFAMN
ncbi:hypothetical protein C2S51_003544 [Perilla frutescens var. frutescens]|nr:hypothetical protein C2S51_003544 [Perilla frutescens var. frutescens]